MNKNLIGKSIVASVVLTFCILSSVGVNAAQFTDTNHWAKNSIDYSVNQGWFSGTSATEFNPDGDMTRGMFVTVLARYAKADTNSISMASNFSDVSLAQYYATPIAWAYSNGIVNGTSQSTFEPEDVITRQEACTIIANFAKNHNISLTEKNNVATYADNNTLASWAYDSVYEMQKYGIFVGNTNNCFQPTEGLKRGEASMIFCRLSGQFLSAYEVVVEKSPGTYKGTFKSTFYCPGSCCNGGWAGTTALGVKPSPGRTIAVDPSVIPLGSYVTLVFSDPKLQQYNGTYRAEDTGGNIKGNRVDVMLPNHAACDAAGNGSVEVYVQN